MEDLMEALLLGLGVWLIAQGVNIENDLIGVITVIAGAALLGLYHNSLTSRRR